MGEPDRAGLMNVELSSDGTRAAVERSVQNNVDVWLVDPTRTARLTNDNATERFPLWSADGTRIAYSSNSGLRVRASSGDGPDEVLYASPTVKVLCDWSPDGQHLLYVEIDAQTGSPNLMTLPVSGNLDPRARSATAATEVWGQFSPDGKWVAYQSNQSGRFEVLRAIVSRTRGSMARVDRWRHSSALESQRQRTALSGPRWTAAVGCDHRSRRGDRGGPTRLALPDEDRRWWGTAPPDSANSTMSRQMGDS